MKRYTLDDLDDALDAVGVAAGDVVMIHSSLLALGRLDGRPADDAVPAIAGRLIDHLGPRGTLVVPTFTFSFCKGLPFDCQGTPAEIMGQLSEYVRMLPGARRSPHPMQSVAALGPLAADICRNDTPSAFDPGGAFARLTERGAKLLMLGTSMEAASFVHLAEQWAGVPYRFWKDFSGEYVDGGVSRSRTYRMYVRDLTANTEITVAPIASALTARGQLFEARLGAGWLTSCRFPDFLAAALDLLRPDPTCLVKTVGAT